MLKVILTLSFLSFVLAPLSMAQVRQGHWTPVVESMERGYSSISYWTYRDDGVEIGGGRISVEHGKPAWPAALDEASSFDAATVSKLWRLGNNKWTTLDTQLAIRFGDRLVDPGIYYLAVERPKPNEWRLAFVSPALASEKLLDAWAAQARPDAIPRLFTVPLRYSRDESAGELDIALSLDEKDMSKGGLTLRWGPHRLDADFSIAVVSPTFYKADAKKGTPE